MRFSSAIVLALSLGSSLTTALPSFGDDLLYLPRQTDDTNATLGTYTGPYTDGGKAWTEAFAKAKALVSQMTTEEKANFTTGFPGPCEGNTGSVVSSRHSSV